MAKPHAVDHSLILDPPLFELAILYTDSVVVGVRGDLDALTAPALSASIGALVDTGHNNVVLDLAAVEFMGAAGLGVVAAASNQLRPTGGTIAIRSPSSSTRRLFDIAGMLDWLDDDVPAALWTSSPERQRLSESEAATATAPMMVAGASTAGVSMAPLSRDVANVALRLITALAAAMVTGADGVSVTLRHHGTLSTVGASDDKIAEMDRDQYATGEGPCLSATAEGHSFHVESSATETRWPQFMPRAIEGGIASILSTPLIVADLPVGALNMYSNSERAFGAHEQELAALFAGHAAGVVEAAAVGQTVEDVAARLLDALRSREVIAHAEGAFMNEQGISATAAASDLRRTARQRTMTVRALAASIMASAARDDSTGEARR